MADSQAEKYAGKYPLLKLLGKGGMGEVWLSHHPGLDIPVAVKILKAFNSESQLNRFIQEGRLAASINHDNIVRVYDADSDGDNFYLVMEYIKGEDYKDYTTKNGGRLTTEQGLEMCLAVCSALSKAHANKIFHRDIKPENIMRSETGEIKLADLGIAKREDAEFQNTMANTPLGTPYYMSPEQAYDASTVDCRTDIYSLGATLYHLLTGTYPFKANTPIQMLMKHINEALEEPIKRNPDIPQELSQIICKMMEKDRDQRYQDCDELFRKLQDFQKLNATSDFSGETLDDMRTQTASSFPVETLLSAAGKTAETVQTLGATQSTVEPVSEKNGVTQGISQTVEMQNTVAGNGEENAKKSLKFLPFYITLGVIFLMFIIFTFKDDISDEINDSAELSNNDQGVTEVLNIPADIPETPKPVAPEIIETPKPVAPEIIEIPTPVEPEIIETPAPVKVVKTEPVTPEIVPETPKIPPKPAPVTPKPAVSETPAIPKPVVPKVEKPKEVPVNNNVTAQALTQVQKEIKAAYNLLRKGDSLHYLQRYSHPSEALKYNFKINSTYLKWFRRYQEDMFVAAFKEIEFAKPVLVSADMVSYKISQKFSDYLIKNRYLPNLVIAETDQYINFKKYNGAWFISEDDRNPLLKYTNPVYDDLAFIGAMLKHREIKELLLRYSHPFEQSEIDSNFLVLQDERAYLLYIVICLNVKRQNPILVNPNAVSFKLNESQFLNFQKYNGKWYAMDDESNPLK